MDFTSPPRATRGATRAVITRIAAVLIAAAMLFQISGTGSAHAATAVARPAISAPAVAVPQSVSSCSAWYTCTVYFSQSETRDWGNMRFPSPPAILPWQIKAAYWGTTSGLAWFAKQYANRGWCSAYRISLVPWASQGYAGYACSWR